VEKVERIGAAGADPVALDIAARAPLERAVEAKAWEQLRRLLAGGVTHTDTSRR
jgi:hypothetical protein